MSNYPCQGCLLLHTCTQECYKLTQGKDRLSCLLKINTCPDCGEILIKCNSQMSMSKNKCCKICFICKECKTLFISHSPPLNIIMRYFKETSKEDTFIDCWEGKIINYNELQELINEGNK